MDSDDPEGQQRRRKMPRTASNNNNTIVNSTTDAPEATSTDAAATTSPTWLTADGEQSGSLVHRDASPAESRSCENCRRSKLKCSRTHPCTKCVAKNIQCIYEQVDKKRGPRPGYVEEIYRRIDMLEHMIVGQSLLRDHGRPDPPNEGTQSLLEIFAEERARLLDLSQTEPTDIMQPASSRGSVSRVKMDGDGQDEATETDWLMPSSQVLQQICETYRHQVQPWVPILRNPLVSPSAFFCERTPSHCSLLQALIAASSSFLASTLSNASQCLRELCKTVPQRLFQSANMEDIQSAVILSFLLFGRGRISDHWGLVTFLPQLALRTGLHLEDQHLSPEHRDFRSLINFGESGQSWAEKESSRRLFWTIFQLDQFTSIISGIRSVFESTIIRRLLPCDGQRWYDNQAVHTREFVHAAIAVQMQVFPDSNIGGFAYVIEATEILSMVSAFALRIERNNLPRHDVHSFMQEFLNLDLILTNWKARLPARFQRASYDQNGYMDHNITLAHMTHNTSGILLYQSVRDQPGTEVGMNDPAGSLFPQIGVVRHAAKEIAKISSRFLLHRRYLVSPQFSYCQFVAARALLAYVNWSMEPLDDDFETLYTSLGEGAKRWNGSFSIHEDGGRAVLDNFAFRLQLRLDIDVKQSQSIDLSMPCLTLLKDVVAPRAPTESASSATTQTTIAQADMDVRTAGAQALLNMGQSVGTGSSSTADSISMTIPMESGGVGNRIFSWYDS